jgi:putative ABC transport system permease protein
MPTADWLSDLHLAGRALRRSPGFVATAVLMLGLAIGVVAGLFSVVKHVLLTPLPYAEPDELVYIAGVAPGSTLDGEFDLSREFYVHYGEKSQLIQSIGSVDTFTNSLRVDERVERIWMGISPASTFATLGVAPAVGRLPGEADSELVVLLSDRLWSEWFGRDPGVIGRSVTIFGAPREVIGVMPPRFRFPDDAPLLWLARHVGAADVRAVGELGAGLVARLKPGATPEALAKELTGLARDLPGRFGGSQGYAAVIDRFQAVVRPLEEQLLWPFARPLWLLLGAAGLVLLIACANLANLLLVRAEARQRELAVRRALGAGRLQLLRLQLAESMLIGLMAGALAMLLAALCLPLLLQAAPEGIPRLDNIGIDATTLGFTALLALFSGLLCGVLPALRGASPSLERLRDGGRGLTARGNWLRHGLVVTQTALALLLLIGAGLLLRSVQALHAVDPGYDAKDVFTFQFAPEQAGLQTPADWARFHQQFLTRLAALPGVDSVGLIENVPLNEGTAQQRARTEDMAGPADSGPMINLTYTAGDYFRSMGISLLGGRLFEAGDHEGRGNLLVSRRAADLLWPGRDPIGQRLQREGQAQWETVVGVVENVLQDSLTGQPEPLIYLPLLGADPATSEELPSPAYVVKSARADGIAGEVRALIREVAPEAPMYRQFTMERLVADSMVQLTFTLLTLGIAAAMALVLGAIGLYGVLSYVVAERTREIGVRMALGARMQQVRGMIVAQGARVVVAGVLIGLLAAAALSQALGSLLFGIAALDLPTFAGMAVAMLAIGLLASYLPARRASRLDPMISLRNE